MNLKFNHREMMLFRECIQKAIDHYTKEIAIEYDDEYCCIKAILEDICIRLIRDTIILKSKYSVNLRLHEGFAFRAAFAGAERKDDTGKWIGDICDQIHAENANKLPTIAPDRLALPKPY